jgi:FkbM family methyltransferase
MLEWWLSEWVPRSGRVFVDVGANEGTWSTWLAGFFDRGHAVEPDPDALAVLRTTVPNSVAIHALGAWSAETVLTFSRYAATVHTSAIFGDEGINTGPRLGALQLPCSPLDALGIDGPVDFIKCDTEGAEVHVLQGARRLIERDRPWLLIEVHSLENCVRLSSLLAEWNYLFSIVRHPDYPALSHWWYAHCWFSCQPIERIDPGAPEAGPATA